MGASGGEVTVTDYTLHGKLVTHLTRGSDEMHFFYDAQGRPAMVEFNGALYSYVHNFQGDIVGIVDSAGSLVVEYKYDAWGKPTLVRTLTTAYEALAELNPFRYRGYVYDEETGLYYLRSRYYNASIIRFINSDSIIALMGEILSSSPYIYCGNSPITFADENGLSFSSQVPPPESGFVPPKGGIDKPSPSEFGRGWRDKWGNIWIPDSSDHGGNHWNVYDRKGNYVNVYPDGHRRRGKGKVHLPPSNPSPAPAPTIEPSPTPNPNEQHELQPEPLPTPQPIPEPKPIAPPAYAEESDGYTGGGISIDINWEALLYIATYGLVVYGILHLPVPPFLLA